MAFGFTGAVLCLLPGTALADYVNPAAYPQSGDPTDIQVAIEIPAGSFTKYEIDAKTGHVVVDRFQSMPVVYPANYGSIASTKGGDGDPLDALVFTREPIYPGAFIRVRPIGVLKMIDGGESDNKIIAVPVSKVDLTYDNIKSIEDLPAIERERIEQFFTVYKRLPTGRKAVELNGFEGANVAIDEVKSALDKFKID
ncbi:MAG: inorganic diphosphatase [Pseudomonadota bacterium]